MSLEENHMSLHVSIHRATCAWAIVLGLVVLVMVSPVNAQPVDIPATWGGDFWSRPRLTGSWGGLRDELGKKRAGSLQHRAGAPDPPVSPPGRSWPGPDAVPGALLPGVARPDATAQPGGLHVERLL